MKGLFILSKESVHLHLFNWFVQVHEEYATYFSLCHYVCIKIYYILKYLVWKPCRPFFWDMLNYWLPLTKAIFCKTIILHLTLRWRRVAWTVQGNVTCPLEHVSWLIVNTTSKRAAAICHQPPHPPVKPKAQWLAHWYLSSMWMISLGLWALYTTFSCMMPNGMSLATNGSIFRNPWMRPNSGFHGRIDVADW